MNKKKEREFIVFHFFDLQILELEKKLAGGKPTPPGAAMKPNKPKGPTPGPPAKPKPATGFKPPPPAAAKPSNPGVSSEFPRTGSVSRNEYKPPSRVNSVSFPPPKATPPKPAAPQQPPLNQNTTKTNGMLFC